MKKEKGGPVLFPLTRARPRYTVMRAVVVFSWPSFYSSSVRKPDAEVTDLQGHSAADGGVSNTERERDRGDGERVKGRGFEREREREKGSQRAEVV